MGGIVVRVKIVGQKSAHNLKLTKEVTVADLLKQLNQNRETVVVRLNGKIIAEEERLTTGDAVEILPVVTGG